MVLFLEGLIYIIETILLAIEVVYLISLLNIINLYILEKRLA